MKDSHSIISQLKANQAWFKLKEVDEVSRLINSLTLELRKYISFAYKKEKILFIALKNPNLCAEFNVYTAPNLLSIIQSCQDYFPTLKQIQQIKAYFPQKVEKFSQGRYFKPPAHFAHYNTQSKIAYIQTYTERCEGEFEILTSHQALRDIFQSIQRSIQANHES